MKKEIYGEKWEKEIEVVGSEESKIFSEKEII